MSNLPAMLEFDSVKPRGFNSSFTRWEQFPQTTIQQNFNKNEVVRFLFQTDKFIDPYQSYLEIEITSDSNSFNEGTAQGSSTPILCLDGQSTSLISEMRIYSNSKEIERIQEYDQLGYILHDINMQSGHKQSRAYEGMKHVSGGNYSNHNDPVGSQFYMDVAPFDATSMRVGMHFNTGVGPYQIPGWNFLCGDASNVAAQQGGKLTHNPVITNQRDVDCPTDISMLANNLAWGSDYTFGMQRPGYTYTGIDPSYPTDWLYTQYLNGPKIGLHYQYGRAQLAFDSSYGIQSSTNFTGCYNMGLGDQVNSYKGGYQRAYAPFCHDDQVDMLIPAHEVLSMKNGKCTNNQINNNPNVTNLGSLTQEKTISTKTYIVPILSGVLGILIPNDQWRLLPGNAFGQLMFEFYLNPHAFFYSSLKNSSIPGTSTSVTADIIANQVSYLNATKLSQWPMNWRVSKMSMHFDLWTFDQAVHQQINQSLAGEGIILSSVSWTLGPTYSISSTQSVLNNWQINNGIPSIKMLFFWFLLNDYQSYNYCRKQYRISQNITSIQLKVGQEYIPPSPIIGHAGNIGRNSVIKADNTNFMMELHRNSGSFFSAAKGSKISAVEFAINERPYNILDPKDISNGASLFHETRCRGKALYTIDTSANPHDQTVLSGLDTTQKRPIELVLNADAADPQIRPSTMYVMFQHDFMVILRSDGVQTMGAG